ncbi:substrate-binding domain-containing protein [Amycolatopsis sp. DSM 110486]|uniref:substrate-binding domain-containing protein n=1 Tax=Amycolatopsis sp. DSM 110486 TaxID=2865832 RepID=UPI001C694B38|nr:substrate-binding domain-containing protein [Amycolatopsis sp. DSM 110486]QYN19938.1 substrate-binding domain-containing protein [Amycolatopsis sp. DSM 110486]
MAIKKKTAVAAVSAALFLGGCATGAPTGQGGSEAGADNAALQQKVGVVGTQDQIQDVGKFCGTKPLTVAFADGFGGNSWRKITRKLFEEEAAKCPNIKKVLYTDAQGDTQKAISDLNSLVAQKVDVIVTFVDGGEALLPTIKKATAAGVKVVPFVGSPGGVPGKDYVDFVSEDIKTYGSALAEWTVNAMHGKGNLVMLGGIAGNSYSQGVYQGVLDAVKKHPDVKLLNTDGPVATDWEPGKTQQVVAGLITKYGTIDGIVSDYGGGSVGGVRAFIAANKPLPVWSANDSNEFGCLWYQYKDSQPGYQIATESSRNWIVNVALHKGLAAANGIADDEPSTYDLKIIEDSTDPAKQPKCEKSLPPDAILSSGLSVPDLQALFK